MLKEELVEKLLLNMEQLAVIKDENERIPVGILDLRTTRRIVGEELIRRRQFSTRSDMLILAEISADV